MADEVDVDTEVEVARARARARQRQQAQPQPEAPIALPVTEQPPGWFEPKSVSGAILRGAGQGLSLGTADELGGAVMAGVGALADFGANVSGATQDERDELRYRLTGALPGGSAYDATRDAMRRENKVAQTEHPKTFAASEIAGSVAIPLPGMAARAPLQTVGSRMIQGAMYGAKLGAASGLGHSESDSVLGVLGDTAGGAVAGGAAGSLAGPAEYVFVRQLRPALERFANAQARKAVTPDPGLVDRLYNMGYQTPEALDEFGQSVRDSGSLAFGRSTGGIYEKALEKRNILGPEIGRFSEEAQQLVEQGVASPPNRDEAINAVKASIKEWADTDARRAVLSSVEKRVLPAAGELKPPAPPEAPPPAAMTPVTSGSAPTNGYYVSRFPKPPVVPEVPVEPPPTLTYPAFWQNKSQMQDALKPNELAKLGDEGYAAGVGGYTRNVWDQLERALGPSKMDDLRGLTEPYGANEEIIKLLSRAYTRAENRQPIGLGDAARGEMVADATGIPGAKFIGAGVSALLRPRWNSSMSVGAGAAAKLQNPFGLAAKVGTQRSAIPEDEQASVEAFMKNN